VEINSIPLIFASPFKTAQVAKLVDALSSGGSAARCAGSNPVLGTEAFTEMWRLFCFQPLCLGSCIHELRIGKWRQLESTPKVRSRGLGRAQKPSQKCGGFFVSCHYALVRVYTNQGAESGDSSNPRRSFGPEDSGGHRSLHRNVKAFLFPAIMPWFVYTRTKEREVETARIHAEVSAPRTREGTETFTEMWRLFCFQSLCLGSCIHEPRSGKWRQLESTPKFRSRGLGRAQKPSQKCGGFFVSSHYALVRVYTNQGPESGGSSNPPQSFGPESSGPCCCYTTQRSAFFNRSRTCSEE
jgi:hypothetical protein